MTLLLTDDEVLTTRALAQTINWEACGVQQVLQANSAQQAREIMEKTRVNLLLCDIEMPGEDGIALLGWVRQKQPWVVYSVLTCHADFTYAQQVLRMQSFDYVLKPVNEAQVAAVVARMAQAAKGKKESEEIEGYGRQWLRAKGEAAKTEKDQQSPEALIDKVNAYIVEHIGEEIGVEKLAGVVYLSPDHLSRIYKKQTGKPLNHYIIDQRMALAARLLQQGLPATDVALQVGYSSYSSFVNMFKRFYGVSPAGFTGV